MSCSSSRSDGIYDRQVAIALFKRLHATNYTLAPKSIPSIIGPGSYTPRTIEEIYRGKACSRYGPYYQQSKRFSLNHRRAKHRCNPNIPIQEFSSSATDSRVKRDSARGNNAVRLDRQSDDHCRQRRALRARAPPATLYEKRDFVDELRRKQTGIYGPYTQFANGRSNRLPEWFKGPARSQDKSSTSIFECLFSSANRHKGKFLPLPSHLPSHEPSARCFPGPTTYFPTQGKPSPVIHEHSALLGFLSSTERFPKAKTFLSPLGPASYTPNLCSHFCYRRRKANKSSV